MRDAGGIPSPTLPCQKIRLANSKVVGIRMQNAKLLQYLRCPEDRSELKFATDELIRNVNSAIRAGRIANAIGRVLHESIDAGLIAHAQMFCIP